MNIKASLRFLAIAGAFLSAKSALAHTSLSTMQTLVAKDALKTQFSDVNTPTNPLTVDTPALQNQEIRQEIGSSQQSTSLPSVLVFPSAPFVDRAQPNKSQLDKQSTPVVEQLTHTEIATTAHSQIPTRAQFSNDEIGAQPAQTNVFSSDVATLGGNTQISSVPAQVEPPEYSVTILVPPPLTQLIKGQPVKKFSSFVKAKATPVVAMPVPTPRTTVTTENATPTLAPRTTVIPVVNLPRTSTPTTVTATAPTIVNPPTAVATSPDAASSEIIYPLLRPAPVTSRYGWRTHPLTGTRRFHSGIDIAAATGTPVVAAGSGTIISAGWNNGYGKAIVIQHDDNHQTLYGHLSDISVQAGQSIVKGTVIGKVGSTGNSTGPHLHFEKRESNPDGWVAIDPTQDIQYAIDNLRRSMPFAQKDLPQGL
jgi:murein DD-endopeptidase MepM/ murein hydrolase activator NlpD